MLLIKNHILVPFKLRSSKMKWLYTYSSICARKWENQNRALLEICTKALLTIAVFLACYNVVTYTVNSTAL